MKIPQKQRGRQDTYDPKLKIVVAREYLTSGMGYMKLAKKYGLPHADTVRHFVKWYKNKYVEQPEDQNIEIAANTNGLTETDLKITALQMLIENASKELGIDLVKKFGTKQQGK
ncbi:MAG: transposase [Pedobacter sp.]|nr:MAG: transposase [Pedobacter sp.]